jgi:hypothetical protein
MAMPDIRLSDAVRHRPVRRRRAMEIQQGMGRRTKMQRAV